MEAGCRPEEGSRRRISTAQRRNTEACKRKECAPGARSYAARSYGQGDLIRRFAPPSPCAGKAFAWGGRPMSSLRCSMEPSCRPEEGTRRRISTAQRRNTEARKRKERAPVARSYAARSYAKGTSSGASRHLPRARGRLLLGAADQWSVLRCVAGKAFAGGIQAPSSRELSRRLADVTEGVFPSRLHRNRSAVAVT